MRWIVLVIACAVCTPAWAQADLGSSLQVGVDVPDLAELFRARPPMGSCPIGAMDEEGMLPEGAHLLHLGVPRFFRDYRRRINLDDAQLRRLAIAQENALEAWQRSEAGVERLEAELWRLTGASQPSMDQVRATLDQLERARSEQRFAYIDAVRQASAVLTPEQRAALVGDPAVRSRR